MFIKRKSLVHLLALFVLSAAAAFAQPKILTVDNNPGTLAQYTDFWTAYSVAQDGDTILLAGSDTTYIVHGFIEKRLNIIGNGYFLHENQIPGLSTKSAKIGGPAILSYRVIFRRNPDPESTASAAGSVVTGIDFETSVESGVDVTFDRCKFGNFSSGTFISTGTSQYGRVRIRRCFIAGFLGLETAGAIAVNSIVMHGTFKDGSSAANCVFTYGVSGTQLASISSSIIAPQPPQEPPTPSAFRESYRGSITYSMAVGGSFLPEGSGNINGASLTNVFVAEGPNNQDGFWKLKPGSPAIGAGLNGVDMGAFGGATPYVLSGVPSRPRITQLDLPPIADNATGLRFEVSAESF